MSILTQISGKHPELTSPNRRVGRVRLSSSRPDWLPCGKHHAFGPLFTDPDTRTTGRDCYRCGEFFPAPIPDGRRIVLTDEPRSHSIISAIRYCLGNVGRRLSR